MRLFVAVRLPDEVLDLLASLPRPEVTGVRWTTRDQWHVTTRFLGAVDDAQPVIDALVTARPARAGAVLGPSVTRLNPRILSVPVAGLDDVAARVVKATKKIGMPPEDRRFKGHVTLARGRGGADLRPLAGAPVVAEWEVDEFVLVESALHPHGARYSVVERFPLP